MIPGDQNCRHWYVRFAVFNRRRPGDTRRGRSKQPLIPKRGDQNCTAPGSRRLLAVGSELHCAWKSPATGCWIRIALRLEVAGYWLLDQNCTAPGSRRPLTTDHRPPGLG
jgi:hypothetical protein